MSLETVGTVFSVIFLICFLAAILGFSIAFAIFFLRLYGAEEDKGCGVAVLPKIVFVVSMTLVLTASFLVPYSVFSGKLQMEQTWYDFEKIAFQIFYAVMIAWVLFVVPFTCCYYESEDPYVKNSWCKQLCCGLCFSITLTIVFLIVFFASYFLLGYAEVPYDAYIVNISDAPKTAEKAFVPTATHCTTCRHLSDQKLSFLVSWIVYMAALLTFIGYFLFVCFGGCGLTSWPVELICSYIRRPRRLTNEQFIHMQLYYRNKTQKLLDIGTKIDKRIELGRFTAPQDRTLFTQFKKMSLDAVEEWKTIESHQKKGGVTILCACMQLFIGFFAVIVSLLWILHIILYLAIQPYWSFGFLNIVLTYIDGLIGFPIVGTVLYLILIWHMLLAVFSGVSQVAGNIPIVAIYPMVRGDTMMSSLLVNAEVFILITFSVCQFCAYAFDDFASNTVMSSLLGQTVQQLRFFNYFYDYVVKYGFLVFAVVGFIFVVLVWICKARTKEEQEVSRLAAQARNPNGGGFFARIFRRRRGNEQDLERLLRPINEGD